jgi:branched-chain amino acid transport system ATP-binding protein
MTADSQAPAQAGSQNGQHGPGLAVAELVVERDTFPIIRGVSFDVPPGEVTVLLGINGAGKTTLLEAISGVIPAAKGTIELDGTGIRKASRRERARRGLGHVEQGRRIFRDLTTEENLLVASRDDWTIDEAFALFPLLKPRRKTRAGLLSGGEQQMLVVARALAVRPKILMADELSLGLGPSVASSLVNTMRTLADAGLGILLVEQFAALALQVGDRAHVLSQGVFAYSGPCQLLKDDPGILKRAYLGESKIGEIGESEKGQ